MRAYQLHTLSNGIRVAYNHVAETKIVHCGLMLDIGSRDENIHNQGIAHFWEHMAFKGTERRNAYHILNRLEVVGGELNAFTDKEKILFFASLRDTYFERALDLLSDITFHPTFPEPQIEKERSIILEEMSMYQDDPDGSLQDEMDAMLFRGHPLGMNMLGVASTVGAFRRKNFLQFRQEHFDTQRIIFSCVGNIGADKVFRLAEKYLGSVKRTGPRPPRKKFSGYKPNEKLLQRDVRQARCAIGRPALHASHPDRSALFLLTNIFGGVGMNSRLSLTLREKHALVYSVGAQFIPFTDTGIFACSFGTEPSQMNKSIRLVREEMRKLCDSALGPRQFSEAREQMMGQIAMAEEANASFMMMMGRSLLDLNRVPSLEEIFDSILSLKPAHLKDMANRMLDWEQMSILRMEPATKTKS